MLESKKNVSQLLFPMYRDVEPEDLPVLQGRQSVNQEVSSNRETAMSKRITELENHIAQLQQQLGNQTSIARPKVEDREQEIKKESRRFFD